MDVQTRKKKNFVHKNPFSCAVCRKIFARKVGLKSHIQKTKHSVAKRWPASIQTILPQEWLYNVVSFYKNQTHYKIKVVLPSIVSVDELRSWTNCFINLSRSAYIRTSRKKNRSSLTSYSEFYRCQHFRPQKIGKKRSKGTGCKSSIITSIKCDYGDDPFYGAVTINFFHNHPVHSGETLRFRKPSVEVEKIFHRMLLDGFSPAHALRNFMIHLEFQPAELYVNSINDRTKCPDYNWVHHFNSKLLKRRKTEVNCEGNLKNMKDFIKNVNEQFNNQVCYFQELTNGDYTISILTPLMKRGLENMAAGEMIFVDSIDCVDKFGLNILLLTCIFNSTIRIPLGIVIASREKTTIMEQGLRLYSLLIEDTSFGGRGKDGPAIIMSDNSKVLVKTLKTVFPKASVLWHPFYFLKSGYCWLLNSKYHVNKDDLGQLYSALRKLVYSQDENILKDNYREVLANYSCNPHVTSYLKTLYEKRQKWALCFRTPVLRYSTEHEKVLLHEMQILKEEILERVKTQPCSFLKYFLFDYDCYYMKKLIDNCVDFHQNHFKRFINDADAKNYTCGPFLNSESLYYVFNKNKNTKYIVNFDIGMCTCYIGVSGKFCRHQHLLMDTVIEESMLQYPMIVEPKVELHYIATGSKEISQTFFDSFNSASNMENNTQFALEVVLKNDGSSESSSIDNIEENLNTHIVEEILIEVDESVLDDKKEKQCLENPPIPMDLSEASSVQKYENLVNNLKDCFESFIKTVKENAEYFEPGLQEMANELKKVNNGTANDRLLALNSFNKYS